MNAGKNRILFMLIALSLASCGQRKIFGPKGQGFAPPPFSAVHQNTTVLDKVAFMPVAGDSATDPSGHVIPGVALPADSSVKVKISGCGKNSRPKISSPHVSLLREINKDPTPQEDTGLPRELKLFLMILLLLLLACLGVLYLLFGLTAIIVVLVIFFLAIFALLLFLFLLLLVLKWIAMHGI